MSTTDPESSPATPIPIAPDTQEILLSLVVQRQLKLSLKVAGLFLIPILALPWINQSLPDLMNRHIFGFSITWLLLGIVVFPVTWVVSAYFVHKSDSIEAECAAGCRDMLNMSSTYLDQYTHKAGKE